MQSLLRWLFGIPLAIVFIVLAVANRHSVEVNLDPFTLSGSTVAFNMPLWFLIALAMLVGAMIGWFACWRAQSKWRKLAKERKTEIQSLETRVRDLNEKIDEPRVQNLPLIGGLY